MGKTHTSGVKRIYEIGAIQRSVIIWVLFQAVLWLTFGTSYLLSQDSWNAANEVGRSAADSGGILGTFLTIAGRNSILFLIITLGNVFVRFGAITLGPVILLIQGIVIGYVAGTNAFEYPFASVIEANLQYLKVGLWETTAYALICAVTMTKSLHIADTFPAKEWAEVRKLSDLRFSIVEKGIVVVSVVSLAVAAYVESYLIHGLG